MRRDQTGFTGGLASAAGSAEREKKDQQQSYDQLLEEDYYQCSGSLLGLGSSIKHCNQVTGSIF